MDEAIRRQLNRDMIALADGERRAFDPVYRTLWSLLVKFVSAFSGDATVAEDVVQQAMLKIFAKASTFDRSRDALTWSMTIAANEYRSHRRKLANRAMDQGEWVLAEPKDDETPEAIAIRNNLRDAAKVVMGHMRPQDLEAIVAALYEGQRPSLAAPAFRKRLQRALANGRLIWKRHYGNDRSR